MFIYIYEEFICKNITQKYFFYCAFQFISIKLHLGYFDLVKKLQKKLTNTIKYNKNIT